MRINGLDTQWWLDDLNAVAKAKPDAVLVPKVSRPGHLEDVAERLVDISADQKIRVWAMMETPLAMLNARDIAAAAQDVETRLSAFVMGTNDLAKETHALFYNSAVKDAFIGNVEGRDIHRGACNVVVTEGFLGNVVLKVFEGLYDFAMKLVHSDWNTECVYRQDQLGSAGYCSRYQFRSCVVSLRINIDKDRLQIFLQHHVQHCGKRERRHDDLCSRLQPQCPHRDVQCRSP